MTQTSKSSVLESCTALPERLGVSVKSALMAGRSAEDAPFSLFGFESLSSTMDVSAGVADREISTRELLPYRIFLQDPRPSGNRTEEFLFPSRTAFLALSQSKGRGRKQRPWISTDSKGIYVTFLTHVSLEPGQLSGVSLAVGLAVQDFVEGFGVKSYLKWPNDVLADAVEGGGRRKLAGILVDAHASKQSPGSQSLHVGIGVNLTRQEFPQEIPGISLEELAGAPVSYPAAAAALMTSVNRTLSLFVAKGFSAFAPIWNERAGTVGQGVEIETPSGRLGGIVLGVESDGGLRLKDASTGSVTVIYSGEIEPP